MAIYQETIIRKNLEKPIQFYGGIHHNIQQSVDCINVELGRRGDGFYLIPSAYAHYAHTDYTLYFNLNEFEIKVAPYHRMANLKINKLKTDKKVLSIAQSLVKKTIDRIAEYKVARNDNY